MNYKIILFFIISLCSKCFAIDHTFTLGFMELCNAKTPIEQQQASTILKSILNRSNYFDIIKWINSKECNDTYPINYAIAEENLFIVKELIDYITYDPNKQRPFSYVNGPITEHINIAKRCYDPILVKEKILKQCSLGNTNSVVLLCNFFAKCLTRQILMDAIFHAIDSNQREMIPIFDNYINNREYQTN